MQHGSLFSGGGGFGLAAHLAGWTNVFHCEKDAFCQRLLKFYWPQAKTFTDIKEFHGNEFTGKIDVLTGGFPCQPFSNAGKRKGTEDDRYLWPEMLRVIGAIKPRWVLGENVLGLVNWNGGMVLTKVLSDLEAQGYKSRLFVLPAAGINAPHQRYRVWIVAFNAGNPGATARRGHPQTLEAERSHSNRHGCDRLDCKDEKRSMHGKNHAQHDALQMGESCSYSTCQRLEKIKTLAEKGKGETTSDPTRLHEICDWRSWPSQSPLCRGNDGFPGELDGITFPKWRNESVKLFGNAIVPQLAYRIFKAIESYEVNYA